MMRNLYLMTSLLFLALLAPLALAEFPAGYLYLATEDGVLELVWRGM